MGNKIKGVDVRELLKRTYSELTEKYNPQEITFNNKAITEIANDSDLHRTRVGHMWYESAGLFQLNGKLWAIARGERGGGYPAEPYDTILFIHFWIGKIGINRSQGKWDRKYFCQAEFFDQTNVDSAR